MQISKPNKCPECKSLKVKVKLTELGEWEIKCKECGKVFFT